MTILEKALEIISKEERIKLYAKEQLIEFVQTQASSNPYLIDENSVIASLELTNYYLKQICTLSGYEWSNEKSIYTLIANVDCNNNVEQQTDTEKVASKTNSSYSRVVQQQKAQHSLAQSNF
jgi:hypothetical protein